MADEVIGRPLRVAVVGSGPAGVYAAQALLRERDDVRVDVLDRLPTPFGLVRYGVAPDHPKIKSIAKALRRVLEDPRVRFLGNVTYGVDVDAADLRAHYDAVVHASGAVRHRGLGVPGEDLPGSAAAADFVSWYNGDPFGPAEFALDAERVAVVGAGNVALDAARMLVTAPAELARTDVPDEVLAAYQKCRVGEVYLFARRGPQHTKFTTPELRELAALSGVDVIVAPDEIPPLSADDDAEYDRTTRNNLAALRDWSQRAPTGAPRRIRLCFWRRPTRVLGETSVEALQVEHTALESGRLVGTGEHDTVAVGAVLRAVGYLGAAPSGLPFDDGTGTVRHRAGQVVDEVGAPMPGVYVAGWIKRGAVGVIGTNKADAAETVHTLLADVADGQVTAGATSADLTSLLAERGTAYTSWDGWCRLERHEAQRGVQQNRPAAKVAGLAEMLDVAGDAGTAVPLPEHDRSRTDDR